MTKKDSNNEPRIIRLNPHLPEKNPNEEPSDSEESSEDLDNIIDFDPIPEEIYAGTKNGVTKYLKPHHAKLDESDFEDSLILAILDMHDQGKLKDQPKRIPLISKNKLYKIALTYDKDGPITCRIALTTEIPVIDAGLRLISQDSSYKSEHLLTFEKIDYNTIFSKKYLYSENTDKNPYESLKKFIGRKYDGSLNLKELEPFIGIIFGEKRINRPVNYEEHEYYCEGELLKNPEFRNDFSYSRVIRDSLFSYKIVSKEHKCFKLYPEHIDVKNRKNSIPAHFKQVFVVKLNWLTLSD